MKLSRPITSLAAAVVALGLAACGDDDSAPSGPLTKAEYIAAADEVCQSFETTGDQLEEDLQNAEGNEQASQIVSDGADQAEETLADLKALQPPDEIAEQANEFVAITEEGIGIIREFSEAIAADDPAQTADVGRRLNENDVAGDEVAAEIGFKECGSG